MGSLRNTEQTERGALSSAEPWNLVPSGWLPRETSVAHSNFERRQMLRRTYAKVSSRGTPVTDQIPPIIVTSEVLALGQRLGTIFMPHAAKHQLGYFKKTPDQKSAQLVHYTTA